MSKEIATRTEAPAALPATLEAKMEYARALAVSGLLPDAFKKKPENVLVAQEYASALSVSVMVLMAETSVIGGRLAMSAKFMRALARRAGHKIRETVTAEGVARCVIIRDDDPDYQHVAEWDRAKAEKHGYWGKGHWQKNPGLMLQNRAVAECVRLACPEVLGGISHTDEEVRDMGFVATSAPVAGEPVTAAEIVGGPVHQEPPVDAVEAETIDEETGEVHEALVEYDDAAWMAGESA